MSGKQQLSDIRDAILGLHKVLVDSERVRYEKIIGPIQSPNQFLQLLMSDPWFAWLHPVSELIVAMDEALDEREPLTGDLISALTDQTRRLLVASEIGEGFSRHYFEALQEDPDVVLAHAAVMKRLSEMKARQP
jgi:hypothetical protein